MQYASARLIRPGAAPAGLLEVIAEDVDGYLGAGAAPAAHQESRAAEDSPHHLDGALALSLQPMRGAHLLKTTVDVEFEQIRSVVWRSACHRRRGPGEAELAQFQSRDEHIDHATKVIGEDQLIHAYREQRPAPETHCRRSPKAKMPATDVTGILFNLGPQFKCLGTL